MKDYLIRGIDKSGSIRIFVATTTNLVEKARITHDTSPTATAALGRTLTAGAMMGAMMKNEEDRLTLKIAGGGSIGSIIAVANNTGVIKGYADNPAADIDSKADGKLDVAGIVGASGHMTVMMDLGLKEPYVGQSEMVSGEIAEDIAYYYLNSEQQPSAVALGVLVDKDISTRAAGGYIIQLLPDVVEEDIIKIENAIKNIEPISTLIDKGLSPEDIMEKVLGEFEMRVLDKIDLEYSCDCSRERIEAVLKSLGELEIKAMIEEDGQAEVVCHFCNTKHQFSKENLENLI